MEVRVKDRGATASALVLTAALAGASLVGNAPAGVACAASILTSELLRAISIQFLPTVSPRNQTLSSLE